MKLGETKNTGIIKKVETRRIAQKTAWNFFSSSTSEDIYRAASNGNLETYLIEHWAYVDTVGSYTIWSDESNPFDNSTALYRAVFYENINAIEALLKAGANPNILDGEKDTAPLHQAAYRGKTKIVASLLKAGANESMLDNTGTTPMQYADMRKHTETAKLLKHASESEDLTHLACCISSAGEKKFENPYAIENFEYVYNNDILKFLPPNEKEEEKE